MLLKFAKSANITKQFNTSIKKRGIEHVYWFQISLCSFRKILFKKVIGEIVREFSAL
jgi:hypothetical protein